MICPFVADPACLHADGTISSIAQEIRRYCAIPRRMVSEDSDECGPRLAMVHVLNGRRDPHKTFEGFVLAERHHFHDCCKALKILLLCRQEWVLSEKRDDYVEKICSLGNLIFVEVFLVIIVSSVSVNATDAAEKIFDLL